MFRENIKNIETSAEIKAKCYIQVNINTSN